MAFSSIVLTLVLCVAASAAPTGQQPIIFPHSKPIPHVPEALDVEQRLLGVNMTFDGFELKDTQGLDAYHFLTFLHYDVMNVDHAIDNGHLDKRDVHCAKTQPNALRSNPGQFNSTSIFHADEKALAAANLSSHFDFVGFSIKPLVTKTEILLITMNAWDIDVENRTVNDVKTLRLGFFMDDDSFDYPWTLQPGAFYTGFGVGANYIELQGATLEGATAEFCIDDLIVHFHEL